MACGVARTLRKHQDAPVRWRSISGGSDGAAPPAAGDPALIGLITSLILDRATCLDCLTSRTGSTRAETGRALQRMPATVRLIAAWGERCRICGTTNLVVFSLKSSA